uniref:Uncharacterized protein n=1 Tax=Rhizophora mucronata TaxID=61149 RepID=A0A2P2L019_RHIMU
MRPHKKPYIKNTTSYLCSQALLSCKLQFLHVLYYIKIRVKLGVTIKLLYCDMKFIDLNSENRLHENNGKVAYI